jgi:uncharacterized membrane protein YphA (DoxX/SURF4 family)
MHVIFVIGRIALVLIFIISGAQKLIDITGTANLIATKVAIPANVQQFTAQAEAMTGLTTHQLLAIAVGVTEFAGGLLIAFNVGTRFFAALLVLFTVAATYYFHDFWNMTGPAQVTNMVMAQKNLAIIGGLLMLVALGSARPANSMERLE